MSGSSKANEPSMDEILASIRKIIADDPSPDAGGGEAAANGAGDRAAADATPSFGAALGATPASPSPSDTKPEPALGSDRVPGMRGSDISPPAPSRGSSSPSFSRLGDALRGTRPSSNPMPSERFSDLGRVQQTQAGAEGSSSRSRSSIENELDDILAEPISPDEPTDRPREGGGSSEDDQWAVWRTQPAKADDGGSKPGSPSLEASRPSGFYPSAKPAPSPVGGSSSAPFQPKVPGEDETRPSSGAFGAFVPKKEAGAEVSTSPADTAKGPSSAPRFDVRPESDSARGTEKPVEPTPAKKPVVIAAMPAAEATSQPKAAAPSDATSQSGSGVTPPGGSGVPLPPRNTLFSKPFSMSPEPKAPSAEPPPAAASGHTATSDAAATEPALPRAAAQLAASSAALNALVASQPSQESRPAGSSQQQGGLQVSSGQPRTLEDMVADMVKPMLQKWLQDNMPRIIEKALRVEVSEQQANANRKPPQT